MSECLIISGGEYSPIPDQLKSLYTIAADMGVKYARSADIVPDYIIGDFDSYDLHGEIMQYFSGVPVHVSPVKKDDTDTMLAIKYALSMGFDHIYIVCGMGLRTDHFLANIQSMHYAAAHGAVCEMLNELDHLRTLTPDNGTLIIPNPGKDMALSLLALTDSVSDLTIKGTEYDGTFDITSSFPIGHGNHIISDHAEISIKKGVLLITQSRER